MNLNDFFAGFGERVKELVKSNETFCKKEDWCFPGNVRMEDFF